MSCAAASFTLPCEPHERTNTSGRRFTATQVSYTCYVYTYRSPILTTVYIAADNTANTEVCGTDGWPHWIRDAMTEYIDAWTKASKP